MGYDVLDTLPEAAFDDIVFLASVICETPIALISLVDESRQWFKARVGMHVEETSREVAFCAHAILQPEEILVVPDALEDPRFATNPLVTDSPAIRFYAGVPLNNPQGLPLGTLCTMDSVPRSLTAEQGRALAALSREVMVHLELRRTVALLAGQLGDENLPVGGLGREVEAAGPRRPAPAPWWPRPWSRCWRPRAGCGTSSTGSRASSVRPRPACRPDVKCRLRRTSGPTSTPPMPSSRRSEPTPGRASSTRSAVS